MMLHSLFSDSCGSWQIPAVKLAQGVEWSPLILRKLLQLHFNFKNVQKTNSHPPDCLDAISGD